MVFLYFGSVRFFKHLILTVIALLIITPTVLCIVLVGDNIKKADEISRLTSASQESSYSDSENSGALPQDGSSGENSSQESPDSNTENSSDSTASTSEQYGSSDIESSPEQTSSASESQTPATSEPQPDSSDPAQSQTEQSQTEQSQTEQSDPQSQPDSSGTSTEAPDYTALYPDLYADKYDGEYINDDNTVYLTFDDGPSVLTENIMYYLKQEGVTATFFVVPEDTEFCRSLLKKIHDAGYSIGIHSSSHDYDKIYGSVTDFLDDFYAAYKIVYEATGERPSIYRFPGGSVNDWNTDTREAIIKEMSRRGFEYFDWNVDSNDWQGYGWTQLYNNVTSDACELSTPVILFHDTGARENTVLVLEDIIAALKANGYSFGSLSQKTEPVHF